MKRAPFSKTINKSSEKPEFLELKKRKEHLYKELEAEKR